MGNNTSRREAIKNIAKGAAATSMVGFGSNLLATPNQEPTNIITEKSMKLKGNINHSVCRWCYSKFSLDELCEHVNQIGFKAIDLLDEEGWKVAQKHGIECSLATKNGDIIIEQGFNDLDNHACLQKVYQEFIPKVADSGIKQLICFSGNRNGISEDKGLENCAKGLESVVKIAEENNVILVMELLNSKVNHPDYQCDYTPWGVELCKKLGSDNFKLLYDIYHMQIMEGDIIATIQEYHTYINHYHTGGVPGRNEINDSQELNYPAIMKAIVATGFKGFTAQEFTPTNEDAIASLREGISICDV